MSNDDTFSAQTDVTLIGRSEHSSKLQSVVEKVLCLGIIWHPNIDRVGEVSRVVFNQNKTAELSRLRPMFGHPYSDDRQPLLDKHISRSPVSLIQLAPDKLKFRVAKEAIRLRINGRPVTDEIIVDMQDAGEEIIVSLAGAVVLSLFYASPGLLGPNRLKDLGFLGISRRITEIRTAIPQMANAQAPVLIRGATGTGKELIARALFNSSDRSGKDLVTVNMATLSTELAPAELFGVKKGAFTGANQDKVGLFEQADGSVLFLDEIGDTPLDVQPMLLRALELGEIRPVGDMKTRKVSPWIIAATDRDLSRGRKGAKFNQPLLQRLQGFTINIPPLRERRIDIGILLVSMLKDSQLALSNLSADQLTEFALYDWPGNVRELQNLTRKLRLGQRPVIELPSELLHSHSSSSQPGTSRRRTARTQYRHASEVDDAMLIQALDDANWIIKDAAQCLRISRTALYDLMDKSAAVRRIEDITPDELQSVVTTIPGGPGAWARHLRVGKHALERRLRRRS